MGNPPERLLAIDPGTLRVGWAIVERAGTRLKLIAGDVIRVRGGYALRLAAILRGLQQVIAEHQPTCAAIESAFAGRNIASALKIGEGRGVALAACGVAGLEVEEYPARLVKRAATGSGAAKKHQVAAMIAQQLGLGRDALPEDLTDACAVAVAHFNRRRIAGR